MDDNFSWGDCYSENYPTNGYIRVPLPETLAEPMDDYDFETFEKWLDNYSTYFCFVRDMQMRNGIGYYGTTEYRQSVSPKRTNPIRRPPRRNYTKRRPFSS